MATREAIFTALFELVTEVHEFRTSSRRLKLWNDVPRNERPALFQAEHAELHTRQSETSGKRELNVSLFVYTDASDKKTPGSIELNEILDALEDALKPTGADMVFRGRQTLGGLCEHAFIDGEVFKDPGDLDDDGMLIVPIKILMP